MTKKQQIENEAYMILSDIAFLFETINNKKFIKAVNLKNIKQYTLFEVRRDDSIIIIGSVGMSKENMYKSALIVERNRKSLLKAYKEIG